MAHGVNFTEQLLESSMIHAKLMWVAFHSTNVFSTIGNGGVEAKGLRLKAEHTSVPSNNTMTQGLSNEPEEHARRADAGQIRLHKYCCRKACHVLGLMLPARWQQGLERVRLEAEVGAEMRAETGSLFCTFGALTLLERNNGDS
ncbi:hypothetical protein Tco_1167632 [Tanacetum coccineum]